MKLHRLILPIFLASCTFGANKDIQELQRDVVALQDQLRTLEKAILEKMANLATLVQTGNDSSIRLNTSLAVLDSSLKSSIAGQEKTLNAPVAGMSSKLDQMSSEFTQLRESIADLSERMNKMQAQMTDLGNTVKVLNQPAAPPPPVTGASATPPPGMSAKQLYDSAMRDRSGGNLELSIQGFQEYLKFYGNTELAPNAQFYIGQIHYDKNDFANALQAFDLVLERFPENAKTADAMYMKGMTLLKSGQRNDAAKEFLNVIQKYPNAEVTAKAKTQRKALGLSVPGQPAARRR